MSGGFSMKRDLRKTLLLLSFVILKAELRGTEQNNINTPVEGIAGDTVTAEFIFQDLGASHQPNRPSLYKNEKKIQSCKQTGEYCSARFVLSDVDKSAAILYIINVTMEDEGIYHVTVPVEGKTPLIFSNKIYFTVKPRNETTEITPISKVTVTETPKLETTGKTFLIYINVSILICICLIMGLLVWFYRTCPGKPAVDSPPALRNRDTKQVNCGGASAVSVSCVEYGVLDFPNRPAREKPAEVTSKAEDGVEYAAIIFPQQKQKAGGRIRDKQRSHPVTR